VDWTERGHKERQGLTLVYFSAQPEPVVPENHLMNPAESAYGEVKVYECKPVRSGARSWPWRCRQGLTLVHVRAQLEQLQDTFMTEVRLYGRHKSSS
jgi:hypothetical protein